MAQAEPDAGAAVPPPDGVAGDLQADVTATQAQDAVAQPDGVAQLSDGGPDGSQAGQADAAAPQDLSAAPDLAVDGMAVDGMAADGMAADAAVETTATDNPAADAAAADDAPADDAPAEDVEAPKPDVAPVADIATPQPDAAPDGGSAVEVLSADGSETAAEDATAVDEEAKVAADVAADVQVAAPCTCSDGNPCTTDGCDDKGACVFAPSDATCTDGSACSLGDHCEAGNCAVTGTLICDDNNICTADSCDAANGCVHLAAEGTCTDGNACSQGDSCVDGACLPGGAVGCDDGNVCTSDSCSSESGCTAVPVAGPCSDGSVCSQGDACAAGVCLAGAATTCDDGNPCTDNGCDGSTGCVFLANQVTCDDGNACTAGESCSKGNCGGGDKVCGKIAIIGDFGLDSKSETDVELMVKAWQPDFIVSTGDNNYPGGVASTIDVNVGKHYAQYIAPYAGQYGPGSADGNRFWPVLGNHDWSPSAGAKAYLDYFTLPGNERYYDFKGLGLRFVMLDSDGNEPDGNSAFSKQAMWAKDTLAACKEAHCIVVFHHAAYSSATIGGIVGMRWPFAQWGATFALSGHDHLYERVQADGLTWMTQGAGGASLHNFGKETPGSEIRYAADFGATLLEVAGPLVRQTSVTRKGIVIDQSLLPPKGAPEMPPPAQTLIAGGSVWHYQDSGSDPGADWAQLAYNDSAWASGKGLLGYGNASVTTTVGYGPSASSKYITTWFRHTLNVQDPQAHSGLNLRLQRDDGAVVYCNGVEVWRSNMPDGPITAQTLASSNVPFGESSQWHQTHLPASILQAGTNVIAVEVHQAAGNSVDMLFDLTLVAEPAHGTALVQLGDTWKVHDDGKDPGPGWNLSSFDVSAWKEGPAPLGFGNPTIATKTNSAGSAPTTWLRKSFTVAKGQKFGFLRLRLRRDDGVLVTLNGKEIQRLNLPVGPIGAATTAGYSLTSDATDDTVTTLVDTSLLVEGVNVLAVELHQAPSSSADLLWDADLRGY